jgi:hypothetical protein
MANFATIINGLLKCEDKNEYIRSLCRYSLLILDVLGIERITEYSMENLFAAFVCCIDILAELIEKYGDRVIDAISKDTITNAKCDYTFFTNGINVVCELENQVM